MTKRILLVIFLSILSFSLSSLVIAFDNKANYVNPSDRNDTRQREYTRENASKPLGQGGYYGGHDTFISEAALLKKDVHRNDSDNGDKFNKWAGDPSVIPALRIGEHDEDTTKSVNAVLNDPPINDWGSGVFHQFYNPDTQKGLWGNTSAMSVAGDYAKEVFKKAGCKAGGINSLTAEEKKKVYDLLGRIGHLIQDMGLPSHVKDDPHIAEPFERYVNDHWSDIVNSQNFKDKVTASEYLNGNYSLGDRGTDAYSPEAFMTVLAGISQKYNGGIELYKTITSDTGQPISVVDDEKVMENVNGLVPEVIKYTAGYIDAMYKTLGGNTASSLNTARIIMLASLESDVHTLAQLFDGASGGSGLVCELTPPEPESPGGGHRYVSAGFAVSWILDQSSKLVERNDY